MDDQEEFDKLCAEDDKMLKEASILQSITKPFIWLAIASFVMLALMMLSSCVIIPDCLQTNANRDCAVIHFPDLA